jgi:DNA-directed RNA polymerase specialized sigma24 family protein
MPQYTTKSKDSLKLDASTITRLNNLGATVHRRSGQQVVKLKVPVNLGRGRQQRYITLARFVIGSVSPNKKVVQLGTPDDFRLKSLRVMNCSEHAKRRRNSRTYPIDGERLTLAEISDRYNVNYDTLKTRMRRGWKLRDAIAGRT